jgi:hypothetical protein
MTRTDFEVDGNAIAAVLEVMPIAGSLRKGSTVAGTKHGFLTIFNER